MREPAVYVSNIFERKLEKEAKYVKARMNDTGAFKIVDDILVSLKDEKPDEPQFGFIVFSSYEKHKEIVIDCIETVMKEINYVMKRLDESLKSEDSQYKELTDLLRGCSFAIVILDGLRPNVLLEYGILKGLGKPCIVLLEEDATVNLASFLPENGKMEMDNPRVDMDKHVSDIKDRFYIRYNKNQPKKIREMIRKEYSKKKKDIDAEAIRILIPDIRIIGRGLRDHLKEILAISGKAKDQLSENDEIQLKIAVKSIESLTEEYKLKPPKSYYFLIANMFKRFNKNEEALKVVDSVIENKKDDIDLIMLKSIILADLAKFEDAIKTIDIGIKLIPKMEPLWHQKGLLLERMDRKDPALMCYKKGIQIDDTCPSIHFRYGLLQYEKKEFSIALDEFEKALELDSANSSYLVWKGKALDDLGKREEAKIAIEEAISFNDNNADAWYTLGLVTSDSRKAIAYFDKALSRNPEHGGALCSKAAELSNIGEIEEALDIFRKMDKFCTEYNSCTTLMHSMGVTLRKKKMYDEAMVYVRKILEFDEENADALSLKASIQIDIARRDGIDAKRIDESLNLFEKALEIDPGNASAWYNQSCAYALLNRTEESIESLKNAIKFDPSFKESIRNDEDFNQIRDNEEFKKILD